MILPANTALPLQEAGKLRVLAATQDSRIPVMPDVPTLAESGVHDADVSLWFGLLAPARTPADIIDRLDGEITRILALPDIQKSLDKQGLTVAPDTPQEFGALVSAETARWADVIKQAGITGN
jgi:tripartite-type tricarboxylate transporter receptor subunit TctC